MTKIPVNPKLPARFDSTPNQKRPASHLKWWGRPYIVTEDFQGADAALRQRFLAEWPSGTRFDVRCLDGGAWDRSTWKGSFGTLAEAKTFVQQMA